MNRLRRLACCLLLGATASWAAPRVAVDVGHTLADPGATSARGRSEFAFNRDLAGILAEHLGRRGIVVQEINFAGDIGSLPERAARAAAAIC